MSSVNKVLIVGNCGKDPEMRAMPSGDAIVNFSLATSETWKDKATGERKEATEWHRCSAFGRLAEIIGQYVKKGSKVYVEGRLATRKWQDKNGEDRYTTEIKVDVMRMLDRKGDSGGSSDEGEVAPSRQQQRAPVSSSAPAVRGASGFDDMDDDIPF